MRRSITDYLARGADTKAKTATMITTLMNNSARSVVGSTTWCANKTGAFRRSLNAQHCPNSPAGDEGGEGIDVDIAATESHTDSHPRFDQAAMNRRGERGGPARLDDELVVQEEQSHC